MATTRTQISPPSAITELLTLFAVLLVAMGLLAFGYAREGYPMIPADGAPALSGLMFFTLGSGAAALLVAFAIFLSSRRNREMTKVGLNT